jgi:hypothetical protein
VPSINVSGINVDSGQAYRRGLLLKAISSSTTGTGATCSPTFQGTHYLENWDMKDGTATTLSLFKDLVTAKVRFQQPARTGAGRASRRERRHVRPRHRNPTLWNWNAASRTFGLFRPGHVEGPQKSDSDPRVTL